MADPKQQNGTTTAPSGATSQAPSTTFNAPPPQPYNPSPMEAMQNAAAMGPYGGMYGGYGGMGMGGYGYGGMMGGYGYGGMGMGGYGAYPGVTTTTIMGGGAYTAAPGMMAMTTPVLQPVPGVAVGLQYLLDLDHVFVQQSVEALEVFIGWEGNNKYMVLDRNMRRLYYAVEDSTMCRRYCQGMHRPFVLHIMDISGSVIMTAERPNTCALCYWGGDCYCGNELVVRDAGGGDLGKVVQTFDCCTPNYAIYDSFGALILRIRGPQCGLCCECWNCLMCGKVEFMVYLAADETKAVGRITKHWGGHFREMYTSADTFGVNFPANLDPAVKATIIGATFLIDFMYFEKDKGASDTGGCCNGCCSLGYWWTIIVLCTIIVIVVLVILITMR